MDESSQGTYMQEKKQNKHKKDNTEKVNLEKCSCVFIKKSLIFISLKISEKKLSPDRGRRYIKEILHSIFFSCYIYETPIHPKDILENELHSQLSTDFPDVFESYKYQLPRRPPYSILLDVVVETTGDQDVLAVLEELKKLNVEMYVSGKNDFCFGATVVSYSHFQRSGQPTRKYFGASMSCKGRTATRIFICVACIETWNDNVAHAVCLADRHHRSITWPKGVWSAAYKEDLSDNGGDYSHTYIEVSPCLLCQEIFPDVSFSPPPTADQEKPSYNHGNCAECEAISNLLDGDARVNNLTQALNTGLEPSLEKLRRKIEEQLRGCLQSAKVVVKKDSRFYNP